MEFSELDLLCLRSLVVGHIDDLGRRLGKYQGYSVRYAEEYQKKIAMAEADLMAMRSILVQLDKEIMLRHLREDLDNSS